MECERERERQAEAGRGKHSISSKVFSLTNLLARTKWMASKLFRKKTLKLINEAGTVEERQVGKRRKEERQRQAEAGREAEEKRQRTEVKSF